jgi:hypothetical protein
MQCGGILRASDPCGLDSAWEHLSSLLRCFNNEALKNGAVSTEHARMACFIQIQYTIIRGNSTGGLKPTYPFRFMPGYSQFLQTIENPTRNGNCGPSNLLKS